MGRRLFRWIATLVISIGVPHIGGAEPIYTAKAETSPVKFNVEKIVEEDYERVIKRHKGFWISSGAVRGEEGNPPPSLGIGGRWGNFAFDFAVRQTPDDFLPEKTGDYKTDFWGVDLSYYLLNWKRLSIGASVGLYSLTWLHVDQVINQREENSIIYTDTQLVYSRDDTAEPAGGINIYLYLTKAVIVGLTYHTLRGVVLRFGYGY